MLDPIHHRNATIAIPPPTWFTRALATPGESRVVEVAGCPIHYLRWGDPARPGLVFVPASGGHAHWYDHIAPLFADQFCVAAIDLAGCGDSGRREAYTAELITAEIMGVCAHAGMLAGHVKPILVGHSAGAQCVVRAALADGPALLGIIAIDGLRYAELAKDHAIAILRGPRPAPRPPRMYESFEEAVARFRLFPEPLAPIANDFIIEHLARHSFRPVEGGWTSKYDTRQVAPITLAFELTPQLGDLACRAVALYCEHTHLADETAPDEIARMTHGRVRVFRLPGTSHYPMFDQPFAFVTAIKGIALTWLAEQYRS